MSTTAVDVHIFGRQLKLTCPVEQVDALNAAAKDLNARLIELREKTQLTNTDKLIMTVALNVCYELAQERAKNISFDNHVQARLKILEQAIEHALFDKMSKNDASN